MTEIIKEMNNTDDQLLKQIEKIAVSSVFISHDICLIKNEINFAKDKTHKVDLQRAINKINEKEMELTKKYNELTEKMIRCDNSQQENDSRKDDYESENREYRKNLMEQNGAFYIFSISWLLAIALSSLDNSAWVGYFGFVIIMLIMSYYANRERARTVSQLNKALVKSSEIKKYLLGLSTRIKNQMDEIKQVSKDYQTLTNKYEENSI